MAAPAKITGRFFTGRDLQDRVSRAGFVAEIAAHSRRKPPLARQRECGPRRSTPAKLAGSGLP